MQSILGPSSRPQSTRLGKRHSPQHVLQVAFSNLHWESVEKPNSQEREAILSLREPAEGEIDVLASCHVVLSLILLQVSALVIHVQVRFYVDQAEIDVLAEEGGNIQSLKDWPTLFQCRRKGEALRPYIWCCLVSVSDDNVPSKKLPFLSQFK